MEKMSSDYLPVGADVFSIARLRQVHDVNQVPQQFAVGGRYELLDSVPVLSSSQGQLLLPRKIEVKFGNLVVLKSLGEYLNIRCDTLALRDFTSHEVVLHSRSTLELNKRFNPVTARLWSQFLFSTREFFKQRGLLEVTTPYLVQNPGMEPELEPFVTHWKQNTKCKNYFLPTSPELHLKQMLSQGFTDIFEIKTAFRNEELTDIHEPEFNMIEWYRGFSNLTAIEMDLVDYLKFLKLNVFKSLSNDLKIEKFTVSEIFQSELHYKLHPGTSHSDLFKLANDLGLSPVEKFTWNDLFHLIWVAKIEQNLPRGPFILSDYPPSQAALARLNERGWADRFEFYWQGFEIANAFHELNDPDEQRARFEQDQKRRLAYGRTPLDIDEKFMSALDYGLPPSGGIALGLDRLFMAFTDIKKIKETRAFTFYC